MQAETMGTILTVCLCGSLGWFLGRTFSVPVRLHTWVLLAIAVVGGAFIGVDTWLLSISGVGIRLNVAISSCAAGIVFALLIRTAKQRRLSAGGA